MVVNKSNSKSDSNINSNRSNLSDYFNYHSRYSVLHTETDINKSQYACQTIKLIL